jgi:hypothetical protein
MARNSIIITSVSCDMGKWGALRIFLTDDAIFTGVLLFFYTLNPTHAGNMAVPSHETAVHNDESLSSTVKTVPSESVKEAR